MFLNARSDLFKVEFPRTFIPKEIKDKYAPYVFAMPTMINDVTDLVNYTIQSVTIPTMNWTPVEQVKPQQADRSAEVPSQNSLGQSTTAAGRTRRWRSSLNYQEIFTKEFQVTFQLIDGHVNYWIMLDTLLWYYDRKNKERFTESIPVRILDAEGNVMFTALFLDTLFIGLTEYQLSYSDLSQEFKTFDASFVYNTLKLDLLPQTKVNKDKFLNAAKNIDGSVETSFPPVAPTGSTGSPATPPAPSSFALRFSGDEPAATRTFAETEFIPDDFSLDQGFTISFWVRPDELPAGNNLVILGSKGSGLESRFHFGVHSNGNIQVGVGNENVTGIPNPMVVGQWYNWVLSYNGTQQAAGDRKVRMWINTDPRMTVNTNTQWDEPNDMGIFFGARNTGGGPGYTNGFACTLDEVAIYNKCIDQDGTFAGEVYNGGTTYSHLTNGQVGLVGYWRFNTGTGNNAIDSSGNGNDAKLTNDLTPPTPIPEWIPITSGEYGP